MTPPDHFLIGISLGNIIYSGLNISGKKLVNYTSLIFLLGLTAAFPDIDSFFGHYTSRNPIVGHRGMTHSFFGVFVISFIITFLYYFFGLMIGKIKRKSDFKSDLNFRDKKIFNREIIVVFCSCFISGTSHLLADLPQPASIWNGIPLFFPLKENGEYIRNGGWSLIGWYDYKIFWTLLFVAVMSFLIVGIARCIGLKKIKIFIFIIIIFINSGTLLLILNYVKHSEYINGKKWEEFQNKTLKEFPSPMSRLTISGRQIFIRIFLKIRR